MYDLNVVRIPDMCKILGLGRNSVLKLCQEKPYNFPVIRVGNRYQADATQLIKWRDSLYAGEFEI